MKNPSSLTIGRRADVVWFFIVVLMLIGLANFAAYPAPKVDSVPKNTLYARVLNVDRASGTTEVVLVVLPKETRIVFSGVLPKTSEGDIVHFSITKNEAHVGDAKLIVKRILWVTEK